jgi:RNA polymerase sigma-70 factor (ECF subfamily)
MHALETYRSEESTEQEQGQGKGELAAFAASLKAHLPALRAKAARMERTVSDAEDLVQDTLERALRSWQRFAPGTNLRCWLHTIMHNLFLDHCRQRNRREAIARDAAETNVVEPARDGDLPPWQSISVTDVQDLSRALRPALRDAVELVFFCGLNYEQAAHRLQIPKATVGTRLLRARRQLRHMIEQRQQ